MELKLVDSKGVEVGKLEASDVLTMWATLVDRFHRLAVAIRPGTDNDLSCRNFGR